MVGWFEGWSVIISLKDGKFHFQWSYPIPFFYFKMYANGYVIGFYLGSQIGNEAKEYFSNKLLKDENVWHGSGSSPKNVHHISSFVQKLFGLNPKSEIFPSNTWLTLAELFLPLS